MIEFDQVQKSYQVEGREVPALHPTSLTVETGEVFGIVGHSGAGKSTLVRLINQLEPPTDGRILIDGETVSDYSPAELRAFRRRVGMIFQHFNL
ncbi:MAG TPA: methionine ABC transporter ATP-binding protein, partial [Marinobacter sp.]|nr:methionine ABC transporter ATP-binding protein [Marinobacter sp.]